MGILHTIDKNIDRLGYWYAGYLLLSGGFGWLAKQLTIFGQIGWPEAVFIGLLVSTFGVATVSLAFIAWRQIKSNSVPGKAIESAASAQRVGEHKALEAHDEETFGGDLLGGAVIGATSIGTAPGLKLPPPPPRIDPSAEHPDKQKAKNAILVASIDYFDPALTAAQRLRQISQESFTRTIPHGAAKKAVIYGLSRTNLGIDFRDRPVLERLKVPDVVRSLTLYEEEDAYYTNYIYYVRSIELALDMLRQLSDVPKGNVDEARKCYATWLDAHHTFVDHNSVVLKKHRDLHTIPKMHQHVKADFTEPDWEKIIRK